MHSTPRWTLRACSIRSSTDESPGSSTRCDDKGTGLCSGSQPTWTVSGWTDPHYALGLMTEPGIRYGHNGGGPGYSAACYHFENSGTTACLLMSAADEEAAHASLLEEMDDLSEPAKQTGD